MANKTITSGVSFKTLGEIVPPRGKLGPGAYRAPSAQVDAGRKVIASSASYHTTPRASVRCIDDRLHGVRLAGGALSQALMHQFLRGGKLLSDDLVALRRLIAELILHDDCKALEIAPMIVKSRLIDPNATGYQFLSRIGIDIPVDDRKRIVEWARTIPGDYFDARKALRVASIVEPVDGPHVAGYGVVALRPGETFIGDKQLQDASGLKTFVITPWVAFRDARIMEPHDENLARAAAHLALIFTIEVFLEIAGKDMEIGVRW